MTTAGGYPCPFALDHGTTAVGTLHSFAAVFSDRTTETPLERLSGAYYLPEQMAEAFAEVVAEAREAGATWEQIGQALRISRQAAQQRFGGAK